MHAPATTIRSDRHTPPEVQAEILCSIEESIAFHAENPGEIPRRLVELDREWDVGRTLAASAAALGLFGLLKGVLGKRRWILLPLAAQGILLQHALRGWSPPVALLRRLGLRTVEEIEGERRGLLRILEESARRASGVETL